MTAPTPKELSALVQFRKAIELAKVELSEKQAGDMALMTWLRARELNIPKSLDMLQKSLAWKKEYDWDNLLTWTPPEHYERDYPFEICGRCYDGSPVFVYPVGKYDIRKAVEAGERTTITRHFHQRFAMCYAEIDRINAERGPGQFPVTQAAVIHDMDGYSFRQMASASTIQCLTESLGKFEANYPEVLKIFFVINAPRIFSMFWAMVKPFMSARTLAKVNLFGYDDKKWKPALLEHIPPDQLPVRLGGTKVDSAEIAKEATTGEHWADASSS